MPVRGEDYDVIDLFRREKITPRIRFQTYENYSAISMIECGLGISVMNKLLLSAAQRRAQAVGLQQEL